MTARPAHLVFQVADRRLAVPAARVARIADIDRVFPLPSDLASNLGLVVEGGVVAALIDLEARLEGGTPGRGVALPSPCVFLHCRRGVVGFPVDEILGVRRLAIGEAIQRLDPDTLEGDRR